jgi:hypothetical protein|tara:strand:+ start:185 stop:361 length:177 start_codon:yes stop_codon:yes gene_type:complete
MNHKPTRSGHTLESAYWTGDIYEIEDEIERLDKLQNSWEFNNIDYETVGDLVKSLYEG